MNRFLYIVLVTVITVVGFTMYTHHDLGSIAIMFAGFTFKTNLLVLGTVLVSALFIVLLCLKTLQIVKTFFYNLFEHRKNRLQLKANALLNRGLIEYTEKNYIQAEKILQQQIQHNGQSLSAYLTAAKTAQKLDAPERRDNYLQKALELFPEANIAIGITQAQFQLNQNQNEQALVTLQQLYATAPTHFFILQLLASTYNKLEDWNNLYALIPDLKKHAQLSDRIIIDYEVAISCGQLNNVSKQKDFEKLEECWLKLNKRLQKTPAVIEYYARCLIELNFITQAEKLLRKYLNVVHLENDNFDSTIEMYSELDVNVDPKVLDIVESWLNKQPNNAYLLLTLGKICLHLSLWGKARNYLEASLALKTLPQTYLQLARLLEKHMNEEKAAAEYYRQGLHLLLGNYNEKVITDIAVATTPALPQLKVVKK